MLKITNLNKYYKTKDRGQLHVINNTTIEIPDSGIIAVVGKSGVGKTTLLNTISGLDNFKNGQISFEDIVLNKYKANEFDALRIANYGFIFQNYYLLNDQTVYQNVSQTLALFDLTEEEKKERINYVLKQLGIAKYTNKLVGSLSGGEQQRVSIARALVKSPKIIFADEPTGSLDEKTTFNVLNILKKISKNCTIFIVTHEKQLISYYADYIIELDEGTVINRYVPEHTEGAYLAVDQNIYLKELNKETSLDNSGVSINFFKDDSKLENVNITLAMQNNRLYLKANQDIEVINEKSEKQIIDGDRLEIKDYVSESFNFELEPLKYDPSRLKYRDAIKKGFGLSLTKSSYKVLSRILLFMISMLTMILINLILTYNNADLALDLTHSEGRIDIELQTNDLMVGSTVLANARRGMTAKLIEADFGGNIMFDGSEPLVYQYKGFYQYEKMTFSNNKYDFRSTKFLDEKDLVYGRMPESRNEIVIDEYFIERLLYNSLLSNVMTDYSSFIGKELKGQYTQQIYKIVGVSRTSNPTVYGDEILIFDMLGGFRVSVITYEDFVKLYPQYSNITLGKGECLLHGVSIQIPAFKVKERLADEVPYKMVINASDIDLLKVQASYFYSLVSIETDGSAKMMNKYLDLVEEIQQDYMSEVDGKSVPKIIFSAKHKYQTEHDEATSVIRNLIKVLLIVSVIFGVVALIFISLSTINVINSQIREIAILRSLGYPKKYVFLTYFIEIVFNSFIYILIGSVIAFLLLLIVSSLSFVEMKFELRFIHLLLANVFINLVTTIIGAIPLLGLLHKTPTKIYNNYQNVIN